MRVLQIRCTPLGNRRRISIPQAFTRSLVGAIFTSSLTVYWVRPFLAPSAEAALGVFTAASPGSGRSSTSAARPGGTTWRPRWSSTTAGTDADGGSGPSAGPLVGAGASPLALGGPVC